MMLQPHLHLRLAHHHLSLTFGSAGPQAIRHEAKGYEPTACNKPRVVACIFSASVCSCTFQSARRFLMQILYSRAVGRTDGGCRIYQLSTCTLLKCPWTSNTNQMVSSTVPHAFVWGIEGNMAVRSSPLHSWVLHRNLSSHRLCGSVNGQLLTMKLCCWFRRLCWTCYAHWHMLFFEDVHDCMIPGYL